MARCTSNAATLESTPPDSPQIARPTPTWARIRSICSSITELALQSHSWILYEAERERETNTVVFTLNYVPEETIPVIEYLKLQERFAGMRRFPEMVERQQQWIDAKYVSVGA